jgi:hypothetical protein
MSHLVDTLAHFHGLGLGAQAACIVLLATYGISDRLWGARKPAFAGKKALIVALTVGAAAIGAGGFAAVMALVWIADRSIPFYRGSLTPTGAISILVAALRHSLPALAAYGMWRAWGFGGPQQILPLVAYAVVATLIGVIYGRLNKSGHIGPMGWLSEVVRGCAYGLALWAGAQPAISL